MESVYTLSLLAFTRLTLPLKKRKLKAAYIFFLITVNYLPVVGVSFTNNKTPCLTFIPKMIIHNPELILKKLNFPVELFLVRQKTDF